MRSLYLFNIDGLQYGVWKDKVDLIRDIKNIHQLPFSPEYIAGLATIKEKKTALADLSLLLGLAPFDRGKSVGHALLLADQNSSTGFIVSGSIEEVSASSDAIHAMPKYLKTSEINSCIAYEQEPIPLIDLDAFYHHVHSKNVSPSVPPFSIPTKDDSDLSTIGEIRLFTAGGEVFAFPENESTLEFISPGKITPLPLSPDYVKGLSFYGGNLLTVLHTAEEMNLPEPGSPDITIIYERDGEHFGFLIDKYLGLLNRSDSRIRRLPPLAESSWTSSFVSNDGEIIPLLNPNAFLTNPDEQEQSKIPLSERYTPASRFDAQFAKEKVEVVEFMLLGVRHAIPKCEIEDVIPYSNCRKVPDVKSIVIGVIEHDKEVIPVLDPAMVFGRRSLVNDKWHMILVRNGDFRAFVITEGVMNERQLPLNLQKNLPVSLSQKLIYGCYPDGDAVRLVLNIEALAVHFDKLVVKELIAAMTKEMAEAPAEIIPSLIPANDFANEETELERLLKDITFPDKGLKSGHRDGLAETKILPGETSITKHMEQSGEPPEGADLKPFKDQLTDESESEAKRLVPHLSSPTEEIRSALIDEFVDSDRQYVSEAEGAELSSLDDQSEQAVEDIPIPMAGVATEAVNEEEGGSKHTILPFETDLIQEEDAASLPTEDNKSLPDVEKVESKDESIQIPSDATKHAKSGVMVSSSLTDENEIQTDQEKFDAESEFILIGDDLPVKGGDKIQSWEIDQADLSTAKKDVEPGGESPSFEINTFAKTHDDNSTCETDRVASQVNMLEDAPGETFLQTETTPYSDVDSSEAEAKASESHSTQEKNEMPLPDVVTDTSQPNLTDVKTAGQQIAESFVPWEPKENKNEEGSRRDETKERTKIIADLSPRALKRPKRPIRKLAYLMAILLVLFDPLSLFEYPGRIIDQPPKPMKKNIVQVKEKPQLPSPPPVVQETKVVSPPAPDAPLPEEKELVLTVPAEMPIEKQLYVIKKGDTLWGISKRFTGDPYNFPIVANDNNIPNPDLIFPKQRILLQQEEDEE